MKREAPSPVVLALFGPHAGKIEQFADLLATHGEERGLLGPQESERIWSRHIVNSAALLGFLPQEGTVIDVGSGAGLPGIVIAIARPDLKVTLLEPMERRVAWLDEVVETLALTNVEVVRGRAEQMERGFRADVVTSRAVAGLGKLIRLTQRLIAPGGRMLALKGRRASFEVDAAKPELRKYHLDASVHEVMSLMDDEATYVVECVRNL